MNRELVDHSGYYRCATIRDDKIVFVCEDDLWEVSTSGGMAKRLTAARGELSLPRISPDGSMIAMVGREEGHPEVCVIPASGGVPRRLTYLGSDVLSVVGWSENGQAIEFVSDARTPFFRESDGYSISPEGGEPKQHRWGHVQSFMSDSKGRRVLGRNASDPARWKRYRGGTAGDIWIDPNGKGKFERLIELDGNLVWPMLIGKRVYFLSDHEGVGNIYSCGHDGKNLTKHTDHQQYYVRFPSTDGKRIVYTAGADIHVFDPRVGESRVLEVHTPASTHQVQRKFVEASQYLESFSPHPDGHSVGMIVRGRPVTMGNWEGPALQHGEGSGVRYRLLEWLPDGSFVAISDKGGTERIELHTADQSSSPKVVSKGDIGRVVAMSVSPDGQLLALSNHRYELGCVEIATGKYQVLDRSPASMLTDFSWAPDSRWIAYSWSPSFECSIIRVVEVATKKVHDITTTVKADISPSFDPGGKYLYFLSAREFYPVVDSVRFDYSFPRGMKPYLVTLRKDIPSPFIEEPRPVVSRKKAKRVASSDSEKNGDSRESSTEGAKKKSSRALKKVYRDALAQAYNEVLKKVEKDGTISSDIAEKPTAKEDEKKYEMEIDFDGIGDRIIGFPVGEALYGQIIGVDNRAVFTAFPIRSIKPNFNWYNDDSYLGVLMAYDFEEHRAGNLQRDVREIKLALDNQTLYYSSRRRIRAVDALEKLSSDGRESAAPSGSSRKSGWLDICRAQVLISPRDEWRQMYEEAWRLQKEQFWDERMSGIDWKLVHDRYERLLPRVRTRSEVSDLIWEMQGELGTSHAYEFGGDYRRAQSYHQGFLGVDLAYENKRKGYRIERIFRGDSWLSFVTSPLARPGLNVVEGDCIVSINGTSVSKKLTVDELLLNQQSKEVGITLKDKQGKTRTVVVEALRDERPLRYRDWVENNRKFVHEATGGRIGYVHIPDMGPLGFAEFHRSYLSEVNREGLIVDVRYNRGGHVSPLLLEKLLRRRVGYDVNRWGPPHPYPPESVAGPMVALTNQFAGSDGDIFSHCFKLYDLGPLVGKRTWGGVIGIWPRHRLVDGTITTQPEFSFWFQDVGWGVENYGTDPDYDVDIPPHDFIGDKDPQMEKALSLVNDLLKKSPVSLPDFSTRPELPVPDQLLKGSSRSGAAKSSSGGNQKKALTKATRSSKKASAVSSSRREDRRSQSKKTAQSSAKAGGSARKKTTTAKRKTSASSGGKTASVGTKKKSSRKSAR